jgi:glycosyltransferase involved in cell wall biosynthesis
MGLALASVSILILTKNEERDLPACLDSVAWSNDIIVYDSCSTDRTRSIALAHGARVVQRPGQDYSLAYGGNEGVHRTWGIRQIDYKNAWLFVIDADERLTLEAKSELQHIANSMHSNYVAYRIRRRDYFEGRELRHVQASPWYIRFFRPEFVHYERLVNPITIVNGPVGDMQCTLDHYPFSKGLSHWISRHNSYSSFEAEQIILNREKHESFSILSAFFEQDFNRRRFHQKELFYRLPGRPLLKFFLLYIIKGGFLDGPPGFTYALLQSIYEAMIVLKVQEQQQLKVKHGLSA